MALNLSEFRINRAVVELRYAPAFLLWDRAGLTWQNMRRIYPAIKLMENPQPNVQQIRVTKDFAAEIHLDRMNVQGFNLENNIEGLGRVSGHIFTEALKNLEIVDLTRIGCRIYFEKAFKTKELLNQAAFEIVPTLKRSGKKVLNIEGGIAREPRLALRFEGPTTGCLLQIYTVDQKLEIEAPQEFSEMETSTTQKFKAILDVDYYAHAETAVSKFHCGALIENWTRIIRRDLEAFVNG
jgi:hypothetical protein